MDLIWVGSISAFQLATGSRGLGHTHKMLAHAGCMPLRPPQPCRCLCHGLPYPPACLLQWIKYRNGDFTGNDDLKRELSAWLSTYGTHYGAPNSLAPYASFPPTLESQPGPVVERPLIHCSAKISFWRQNEPVLHPERVSARATANALAGWPVLAWAQALGGLGTQSAWRHMCASCPCAGGATRARQQRRGGCR